MNKTEALVNYLSIDPLSYNGSQVSKDPNSSGYQIRIKCDLDNYAKDCLSRILENYKLVLTEDKDYIDIV